MSGGSGRDQWIEYGASDEAIVAAVSEQRRYVMHMLGSRRWEAEDVMAQLALDMVASMPRWVAVPQRPRPALGAWARGVAVRTFYAWLRGPGTGHAPDGSAIVSTDVLQERGWSAAAAEDEPVDELSSLRGALVGKVRQVVMQQPGGAAVWESMVTPDGRVRGKAALARLRLILEVTDPTGSLRRTAGLTSSEQLREAGAAHAAA